MGRLLSVGRVGAILAPFDSPIERGTTRSHLIREAIEARYGTGQDDQLDRVARILGQSKGLWSDRRETAVEYVDRLRTGNRWGELFGEADDIAARHADPD